MKHDIARAWRLSKETLWIVSGQVAALIGGLYLVRLLTGFLDPETYGEVALGIALSALLHEVLMGGAKSAVERFYHIANRVDDLSGFVLSSLKFVAAGIGLVTLIGIGAVLYLAGTNQNEYVYFAALLIVFAIANGLNSICNGLQNAARKRAVVALHTAVNSWLKVAFALLCISHLGPTASSVVLGYCIASAFVNVSQFSLVYRLLKPTLSEPKRARRWTVEMWIYSWPYMTWALFTWAQQASDRWALQGFGTLEEVGLYAVVFQLSYTPIAMATQMLSSVVAPILFGRAGDASDDASNALVHKAAWQMAGLALAGTAFAGLTAWLLHTWLFSFLVAEAYQSVSYALPYLVLAGGVFASGQLLSIKILSELRAIDLLYVKIGSAIIGLIANIVGAAAYGLEGVLIGQILFSATYFLGVSYLSRAKKVFGAREV
jgi:O-antigen/teichoic acid export membrane protein